MAEFCKKCFIELNPELTEKDFVMIKGDEFCEGCGKIVDETVLKVKENLERKFDKNDSN